MLSRRIAFCSEELLILAAAISFSNETSDMQREFKDTVMSSVSGGEERQKRIDHNKINYRSCSTWYNNSVNAFC